MNPHQTFKARKSKLSLKIGQGLLLTGDPHVVVFFHFLRKFKMAAIPVIPCGSKISTKSLYLARLRRYKQFCIFPFFAKIQNGRHFWGGENFLKIAYSTFLLYPVGRKFRRNHSISRG